MNIVAAAAVFVLAFFLVMAGLTRIGVHVIDRRYPPVGTFADIGGTRIHHVHVPAPENAVLPPIVFIHGASGNLLDQMIPLRPRLEGKAEMLFFDRPGHGWSERESGDGTPDGQADRLAALMDRLGIGKAVIAGHSFGGGIAGAFALRHPDRVAGLVFISAATHPWPGGGTSWYYKLTNVPVAGWLFSETLALPAGWLRMRGATACVFAPNQVPAAYAHDAAIPLVLRPQNFRANAEDVESLYAHTLNAAPRYGEIGAPTVVISGDSDTVVYEEIHSLGLERDIPGAKLLWIRNLGHKPDYVAGDLVVAAIGAVAGAPPEFAGDPDVIASAVEARIAGDAFGPVERCKDEKPPIRSNTGE